MITKHDGLIRLATIWLKKQCSIVASDVVHAESETPDAIGFGKNGKCILCEAKTSRSDFLADRKKYFRTRNELGMGCNRYYVAPEGLIGTDELPDGWGLLEDIGGALRKMQDSRYFYERNHVSEQSVLVSLLRRIGQQTPAGVSIKAYRHKTTDKPRTTLSVEEETK